MQVIREDDGSLSPSMIITMTDWKIRPTCYVKGCDGKTTTIVTASGKTIGLCEAHHQRAVLAGEFDEEVIL